LFLQDYSHEKFFAAWIKECLSHYKTICILRKAFKQHISNIFMEKKGFFKRLFEKLDEKLEKKSKEASCCEDSKDKCCK
tara:strand:+ start:1150 stop:1386 length:237 start_codon:yes stop_codon:yes gene_type:complete